jgi:hydroxylamine reductase
MSGNSKKHRLYNQRRLRENEEVAKLQDLLIYTLKGISDIVVKGKVDISKYAESNYEVLSSLFMTITNANFDDGSIERQIRKMLSIRDELRKSVSADGLHDAATFVADSRKLCLIKPLLSAYWPQRTKIYALCVK